MALIPYACLNIRGGRPLRVLFPLSRIPFHLSFMYGTIAHHLKQLQRHLFYNVPWLPKAMTHSMFWKNFRHTSSQSYHMFSDYLHSSLQLNL